MGRWVGEWGVGHTIAYRHAVPKTALGGVVAPDHACCKLITDMLFSIAADRVHRFGLCNQPIRGLVHCALASSGLACHSKQNRYTSTCRRMDFLRKKIIPTKKNGEGEPVTVT